jgi:hypothetical protein
MIDFAESTASTGLWQTYIARPGGVVKAGTIFGEAAALVGANSGWAIRSDVLALALIDTAVRGNREQLVDAQALLKMGQQLKSGQKEKMQQNELAS